MSLLDRRSFGAILSALGVVSLRGANREPEILRLSRNGWMPNNEHLPVVLYRDAADAGDPASYFEKVFQKNGWPARWRNGVFDYHHYHSTAHEVLGFAAGNARIILGGENGKIVSVRRGDVALLPTGTGHCRIEASSDFLVVGGYPTDQTWDICRRAPDEEAVRRMKTLPFPASDPVRGQVVPLTRFWPAYS